LEVQFPTVWTDEAAEVGIVREEKGRRKKMRGEKESEEGRAKRAKKSRKVTKHWFSNVLWLPRPRVKK
jgi:hypothetical protein